MERTGAPKINFRWNFASLGNSLHDEGQTSVSLGSTLMTGSFLIIAASSNEKSIGVFGEHGLIHTSKITCFDGSKKWVKPTLRCTPRVMVAASSVCWNKSISASSLLRLIILKGCHLTSMADFLWCTTTSCYPQIRPAQHIAMCLNCPRNDFIKCWASQSRTSLSLSRSLIHVSM